MHCYWYSYTSTGYLGSILYWELWQRWFLEGWDSFGVLVLGWRVSLLDRLVFLRIVRVKNWSRPTSWLAYHGLGLLMRCVLRHRNARFSFNGLQGRFNLIPITRQWGYRFVRIERGTRTSNAYAPWLRHVCVVAFGLLLSKINPKINGQ